MKKPLLILAMIFLFQNMMYADEARGKGKRFEENKVRILGNIDKKIGFLNEFKSCVTSASSRGELKSCRTTNKKVMQDFRASRKTENEERKKLRAARKKEREKRRSGEQ